MSNQEFAYCNLLYKNSFIFVNSQKEQSDSMLLNIAVSKYHATIKFFALGQAKSGSLSLSLSLFIPMRKKIEVKLNINERKLIITTG